MAGIAGMAGMTSTAGTSGSGATSPTGARPAAKEQSSGGCSTAPGPSRPAPWLLTAFGMLGVLLSRRRSQAARAKR
jgi:MYXO-CTERM domain-containing protein